MNDMMEAATYLEAEEEQALIARSQKGDDSAFEGLVKAYMKRAYYVALGLVGNHEDALDCSQEAFVKAYRALDRFRLGEPFLPWLYRITRNHCLNFLKKEKRGRRVSLDYLADEYGIDFASDRPGPRAQAAAKERDCILWEAIERLKPDFKEIILLKHFHHFSYKEMAESLDVPIGTVMSRLYNARAALRKTLEREHFEEQAVGAEELER